MTVFMKRTSKVSSQELAESISFMRKLAQEKDIGTRRLNADEVRKVIHFVDGVSEKVYIQRLLPQDAVTLLKVTPALLEAKSNTTIHNIIHQAGPIVKDLYQQDPKPEYHSALEDAGKVCFSRNLRPTGIEGRTFEFELFKDIVGETENYKTALNNFKRRNSIGYKCYSDILQEAANAYRFQKG